MSDATQLATQIVALRDMHALQLQARYAEVTAKTTKSRNAEWLRKHLARRLAAQAADDPATVQAVNTALTPRPKAQPFEHDRRVPPVGSVIRRPYRGRVLAVRVTRTGFKFEGRAYTSLSAIAREVTGARWSGPLFFGLAPRKRGRSV